MITLSKSWNSIVSSLCRTNNCTIYIYIKVINNILAQVSVLRSYSCINSPCCRIKIATALHQLTNRIEVILCCKTYQVGITLIRVTIVYTSNFSSRSSNSNLYSNEQLTIRDILWSCQSNNITLIVFKSLSYRLRIKKLKCSISIIGIEIYLP